MHGRHTAEMHIAQLYTLVAARGVV